MTLDTEILQLIQRAGTLGIKRVGINVLFRRHATKAEIAAALELLAATGRIRRIAGEPMRSYPVRNYGGRKPETWTAE